MGEQTTTTATVKIGARVRHDRLGLGWVWGLDADGARVAWDAARVTGLPIAVDRLTVVPQDGDPYTAVAEAVDVPAAPPEQTIRSGDRVEWVAEGVMMGIGVADDVDMKYAADGWITVLFDGDTEPTAVPLSQLQRITDSAGPASSSASTGGTGGLADTAAQLAVSAKDLARLTRDVREELEGRRRELWGLLVEVACEAEETKWEMPALVGKVMGLRSAYRIVTGIGTADLNELLAAELDSRYRKDRAKGGERRG
jgi:hypothetical protein